MNYSQLKILSTSLCSYALSEDRVYLLYNFPGTFWLNSLFYLLDSEFAVTIDQFAACPGKEAVEVMVEHLNQLYMSTKHQQEIELVKNEKLLREQKTCSFY